MKCPSCGAGGGDGMLAVDAFDEEGEPITVDENKEDLLGRCMDVDPLNSCRCQCCGYEADAEDFIDEDPRDPEEEE